MAKRWEEQEAQMMESHSSLCQHQPVAGEIHNLRLGGKQRAAIEIGSLSV